MAFIAAFIAEGSGIKCRLLRKNIRKRNLEVMRTKVILVEATGCGGKFKKPIKLCNEVKVEVESANSYTVEVTAATFTSGESMGYMAARVAFVTHQSQECMGVLTDTATAV